MKPQLILVSAVLLALSQGVAFAHDIFGCKVLINGPRQLKIDPNYRENGRPDYLLPEDVAEARAVLERFVHALSDEPSFKALGSQALALWDRFRGSAGAPANFPVFESETGSRVALHRFPGGRVGLEVLQDSKKITEDFRGAETLPAMIAHELLIAGEEGRPASEGKSLRVSLPLNLQGMPLELLMDLPMNLNDPLAPQMRKMRLIIAPVPGTTREGMEKISASLVKVLSK